MATSTKPTSRVDASYPSQHHERQTLARIMCIGLTRTQRSESASQKMTDQSLDTEHPDVPNDFSAWFDPAHASEEDAYPDLFYVLQRALTRPVMAETLTKHKVKVGANWSWARMWEEAIAPAIRDETISEIDLLRVARTIEGFRAKHVYLYRVDPSELSAIDDRSSFESAISRAGLSAPYESPRAAYYPETPTLTEIWYAEPEAREANFKFVETRSSRETIDEQPLPNGDIATRWRQIRHRAPSIVRISSSGIVEVRVHSTKQSDAAYRKARDGALDAVTSAIPMSLKPISLYAVPKALYEIAGPRGDHPNLNSVELSAAGPKGGGIKGELKIGVEHAMSEALKLLEQEGGGASEGRFTWYDRSEEGDESSGTKVKSIPAIWIAGDTHEFRISNGMTQEIYEKVLSLILEYAVS